MKSLLATLVISSALALPYNPTITPPVILGTAPAASVQPEPVVLPVIPAAIVVGVGVGVVGWLGIKALNGILRIREHQLTNGAPADVQFTVPLESEDYPE